MVRSHPTRSARVGPVRAGLVVSALLVMCAALPAAASAQDGSCRGSAVRAPQSEPVVANAPATPCVTDAASAPSAPVAAGLTVTNPKASTLRAPGVFAAEASVEGASFGGAVLVTVGVVEVSQVAGCSGGTNVATGSSSVTGLTVAGQPVAVPAGQPLDQQLGAVRVRANQFTAGTVQGLVLDIGGQQTVIGEATATGDACATLGGPVGSGPGGAGICPQGSTYEVTGNRCVIREGGEVIVVSSAYQGPTGGSVISLTAARALVAAGQLTGSRCLSGAGPRWVLLGTAAANRLTGTRKADRILALSGKDRVLGGRGKDCADGARGSDRLKGGAANDRLVGGKGNDRLMGGAGNDRLRGGAGRDRMTGAAGKDRLDGGRGNDGISGAKGRDRLYGRGGNDRLRSGPGRDMVRPGPGRDRVS